MGYYLLKKDYIKVYQIVNLYKMADPKKAEKPIQNGPFKVFFISSNQSSLDDKLEYSIKRGASNLQKVFSKKDKYKREDFSIYVFCFDIIKENLRDKDEQKKLYKAIIKLEKKEAFYKKNNSFEGSIFFKETLNNFIYDFKFEPGGFINKIDPPITKALNRTEKLKLFSSALTALKIKQNHKPSIDLIMASQKFLIGQKYTIDFFLQIMKCCFTQKEVIKLLRTFNFNKLQLPDYQFDLKGYTNFLNSLEKNPKIVTKHCLKTDDPEKFNKIIYSFLLYYKVHYEPKNVKELLLKKELSKYFIEILPSNYPIFQDVEIPEGLISEMLKQKDLNINIINGTLFYLKTLENILLCINENIDKIYEICSKEKKEIKINDLTGPKTEDNIKNILEQITKIVDYEKTKKKFVIFDEELFKNYLHFSFKKDLNKLILIKKAILYCQKVDKELDPDYNSIIHETAVEMIKIGQLKNLELLNFIENEDVYFIEDKRDYKNLSYRPLCVFDGFDLESMDEKFFDTFDYSHRDYPLFLPCIIARFFNYIGKFDLIIPLFLSVFFTLICFCMYNDIISIPFSGIISVFTALLMVFFFVVYTDYIFIINHCETSV